MLRFANGQIVFEQIFGIIYILCFEHVLCKYNLNYSAAGTARMNFEIILNWRKQQKSFLYHETVIFEVAKFHIALYIVFKLGNEWLDERQSSNPFKVSDPWSTYPSQTILHPNKKNEGDSEGERTYPIIGEGYSCQPNRQHDDTQTVSSVIKTTSIVHFAKKEFHSYYKNGSFHGLLALLKNEIIADSSIKSLCLISQFYEIWLCVLPRNA